MSPLLASPMRLLNSLLAVCSLLSLAACSGSSDTHQDADGDLVEDDTDNCPSIANTDQLDSDEDGAGDACSACQSLSLAADLWSGIGNGEPTGLAVTQEYLYFQTTDGVPTHSLWVHDPENLTIDAEPIVMGDRAGNFNDIAELTPLDGMLYFTANGPVTSVSSQREGLWVYDSSRPGDGARRLAEFNYHKPRSLTAADGNLYFTRTVDGPGFEIWRYSPPDSESVESMEVIVSANPSRTEVDLFFAVGHKLYLRFRDSLYGSELWFLDTNMPDASFSLVADIVPRSSGSFPNWLTELDGILYFSAYDDIHGRELWGHDTQPAFSADDSLHGKELWVYDPSCFSERDVNTLDSHAIE